MRRRPNTSALIDTLHEAPTHPRVRAHCSSVHELRRSLKRRRENERLTIAPVMLETFQHPLSYFYPPKVGKWRWPLSRWRHPFLPFVINFALCLVAFCFVDISVMGLFSLYLYFAPWLSSFLSFYLFSRPTDAQLAS
ncbi:MAG: hypothetical protein KDB07_06850, partial [Planctomycetes bacterium]|nr:hypothetical protein [Planctomycetota bacterium]